MTRTYAHRVRHHTMARAQIAFEEARKYLEESWSCPIERLDVDPNDTLGVGDHMVFFRAARDDLGRRSLLAHVPGNATALSVMSNADLTGVLYSLHNVWFLRRDDPGTPLYVLADRFDDRLTGRCRQLDAAIRDVTLLPVRNVTHRLAAEQRPANGGKAPLPGTEATLEADLRRRLLAGELFAGDRLAPLGTQVPAGWARSRAERIDMLAVDGTGRLVVLELKAVQEPHANDLRHAVFQSLRYWDWVKQNRRALQIVYGRDLVSDIDADPALFVVNAGTDFPEETVRFRPLAPSGTEALVRFFRCDSVDGLHEAREEVWQGRTGEGATR